ncbi:VOC family protein [Sphingomonas sp. LaA6.9]|uniref:VOC family protein n=1 Tax=Sphingomonas sp. LaA6.9 TaxID=2919914 RepID=UPI001F4F1241|nr:VOC family protein [Sphingomonas sp. LaA6.9]MCJ8159005.1 VOC family protein [Sphingomonas sp. LaA6.9]
MLLEVSDIEQSTQFATDVFGLDLVTEDKDGARYFRAGASHHDIILAPAQRPSLARSSWELESSAELEAAFGHFESRGFQPLWVSDADCAALKLDRAFRMIDPVLSGTWEFFAGMTTIPSPRKNMLTQFQGGKHFGLFVPDCPTATDFLVKEMGFLVSDYFEGNRLSLLRAWPNPNHHSVALIETRSSIKRMHHVAFMVNEIDDIGRLFNRAQRFDAQIQFGIGRHPTSGSIHLYIYGPDYFVWEYTLGMEQFPEAGAREARRMSSAPEDFDLWGAIPDATHKDELPELKVAR